MDSRLSALDGDEAAQAILGKELPQLLGILKSNDLEFTTQTFRQLSTAFFLGLNPEKIDHLVGRLAQLTC